MAVGIWRRISPLNISLEKSIPYAKGKDFFGNSVLLSLMSTGCEKFMCHSDNERVLKLQVSPLLVVKKRGLWMLHVAIFGVY